MTLKPRAAVFAALLSALAALPVAPAFAEAPNTVNNATTDNACANPTGATGLTGPYDSSDAFRDATGRPCPGWEYLFYAPS